MATRRHERRSGGTSSGSKRAGGGRAARSQRTGRRSGPSRPAIVWAALVGAMTFVGGGLLVLDGGKRSALDGLRLPSSTALMAVSGPGTMERVLETREPLSQERWLAIMVHHSGSAFGTPESIEREHRGLGLRRLGHHFLIGNGNGMGDGEVHVGGRWLDQQPGAHAAGEHETAQWANLHAVSICLVGDGNRRGFTEAQFSRLMELVELLSRELGIPAERIVLHSDESDVADPGVRFPAAAFREMVAGMD